MAGDLSGFSKEELLAELVRRMNAPQDEQDAPWCHDCGHFRLYEGRGEVPKYFNPCAHQHRPAFWVPKPWESPEHSGFFRTVCEDRVSILDEVREDAQGLHLVPPKRR
jgi:hypothetical protein